LMVCKLVRCSALLNFSIATIRYIGNAAVSNAQRELHRAQSGACGDSMLILFRLASGGG
jgi:hypothetical protein